MSLSEFSRHDDSSPSSSDSELERLLSQIKRPRVRKRLFRPSSEVITVSSDSSSDGYPEFGTHKTKDKSTPEVIDLCSDSSDQDSYEKGFLSFKAKTETKPIDVLKRAIPDFCEEYCDPETRTLPILAHPVEGLGVTQLLNLTIGSVPPDRICKRKPTGITQNSVFVIDLSCIRRLEDLRAHDNGVWVHGGKPRRQYIVEFDESQCEVVSAAPVDSEEGVAQENLFTLIRLYHRHKKTTPQFQRRISYVLDYSKQVVRYAVMQYLLEDGNEVPVILPPHGNAKRSSTSHRRTQFSTLKMIKESKAKPKIVVSEVHKEMGSSIEARSASELPRNRRQVYNSRQQSSASTGTDSTASGSLRSDPIFELIKQCKEDMLPHGHKFVRSVNIDPTPSCILASESQLKDLRRFCTDPAESCVLGVDSTFDLGKFYITITTYRYLHVENKSSSKPPVFFGPIYVHTEKTYETFYHFFSTLLKLEPSLNDLVAIGTDGDPAMEKAIRAVFPNSLIHLRCFIHMKDNIRRKLTELLLPRSVRDRRYNTGYFWCPTRIYVHSWDT